MWRMNLDLDYTNSKLFRSKTKNVVTLLNDMRSGKTPPRQLQREVTQNRATFLEVSKQSSLEHYYSSEVTAIDLEKSEERYLITGSEGGSVAIHDLWNFTKSLSFTAKVYSQNRLAHGDIVKCVQWDPSVNSRIVTSGYDKRVKVWDVNHGRTALLSYPVGHYVNNHHIGSKYSTHRLIAIGMKYPGVILLDTRCKGGKIQELMGHRIAVSMVQWSPTSEFFLASGGIDGRIFFWDIRSTNHYLKCLDQSNGLHDDFKYLILCNAHNDSINSIKFTDDGLMLVSHCIEGYVKLWSTESGKYINRSFGYPIRNQSGTPIVMDICWEGKEPLLFVPCNLHIIIYNLATGTRMRTMIGHTGFVTGCAYYSSACELYSVGRDSNIIKWTENKISGLKRLTREAWVWS